MPFGPADVRARWADSGLAEKLGPPLLLAGRLVAKRLEQTLAAGALGLTPAQARVMVMLHIHGPLSQQGLAACTDVEPSTIVRTLDVLEREGFARREPDPGDRRAYLVRLTAAGQEILPRLFRLWEAVEAELHEVVEESERQALQETLHRVIARLWSAGCADPAESGKENP